MHQNCAFLSQQPTINPNFICFLQNKSGKGGSGWGKNFHHKKLIYCKVPLFLVDCAHIFGGI